MPLALTCNCGKSLRLQDTLAGRKIRCPACQEICTVPPNEASLEDAALNILLATPAAAPRSSARPRPAPRDDVTPMPFNRRHPRPLPISWRAKSKSASAARAHAVEEDGLGRVDARTLVGILMLVIGVAWIASGLAAGYLLVLPLVLMVVGTIAAARSLFGAD